MSRQSVGFLASEAVEVFEHLTAFFSSPDKADTWNNVNDPKKTVLLPFPSVLKVPRIELIDHKQFAFFGRSNQVENLVQRIAAMNIPDSLIVRGSIGSGKSNLIATAVLRLMDGVSGIKYRVIYISDCKLLSDCFHTRLLQALQLAFSEDVFNFDFEIYDQDDSAIRTYICSFINSVANQCDSPFIFVYDGFNHYETARDGTRAAEQRDFLVQLAADNGSMVLVMSSQNASHRMNPQIDYYVNGGLSTDEWNGWKQHAPFNRLASYDQDKLEHITGLIPVILRKMAKDTTSSTLDESLQRFYDDNDSCNFGGHWAKIEMIEFTEHILQKPVFTDDSNTHILMMQHAINGTRYSSYKLNLMDHRFFYLTPGNVIVPVCGFVKEVIVQYLAMQAKGREFFQAYTKDWFVDGFNNFFTNSCMKEYFFKQYAIAQILLSYPSRSNIKIVYFCGNFPAERQLSTDPGWIYVYMPVKFNVRYIDLVIRRVFLEYVADETETTTVTAAAAASSSSAAAMESPQATPVSGRTRHKGPLQPPTEMMATQPTTKSKKKKRRRVQVEEISFYQITLQTPMDHQHSLEVFTVSHNEDHEDKCDYLRYKHPMDSNIRYKFIWVVPVELPNHQLPPLTPDTQQILGPDIMNNHLVSTLSTTW